MNLRVLHIVEGTSVDGPGLRTSIYLAGCNHHCPGCHNPASWNPQGGEERTLDELMQVIAYNEAPVTLSGGDPLQQPDGTRALISRIKHELGYNIWCYTGYRWEQIIQESRFLPLLQQIDVLVEGPFILAQRNIQLRFRGSENQRIVDVPASLREGKLVDITNLF
jgi:anaerobic ribonucleoside-triphosphate reductase activating protein